MIRLAPRREGRQTGRVRDLIQEPAWREEDLGCPLPDATHAVSVCLPTWDAVVGYEEGREKVVRAMRCGYPRFFRHPAVSRLVEAARQELAGDGEAVVVFPTRGAAQRALRFVELREEVAARISSFNGLQALVFPEKASKAAWEYWRFAGEVVTSRQAIDALDSGIREGSKTHLLQRRLGKLFGVPEDHTFVFSSGMAAATATHRALPGVKEGKKTLQLEFPYVDCLKIQELFGNGVVFLNEAEGESFQEALRRVREGEFAAVFTEVPSNPLLRTPDIPLLAEACRIGGTPLIIDDSAASVSNVQAIKFADVVTSSLTKWLSGAGDVIGGAVTVRPDSAFAGMFLESLSTDMAETAPMYIADAEALLGNMKEYPKRMAAINENGERLAAFLAGHPAVAKVWHPSLNQRDHYDQVKAPGGGYGGLLSFVLHQPKKSPKVYDALEVSKGPSFGTEFTLVCPYTLLAHWTELDWAEACGIPRNLIRVSCGREPYEQLQQVFATALEQG